MTASLAASAIVLPSVAPRSEATSASPAEPCQYFCRIAELSTVGQSRGLFPELQKSTLVEYWWQPDSAPAQTITRTCPRVPRATSAATIFRSISLRLMRPQDGNLAKGDPAINAKRLI